MLFAERILVGLRRWLERQGAQLHPETAVTDLDPERLAVRTGDGRTDSADALVVAAGPWTPRFLPALRGRVTPSRQVALYLEPPPDLLAAWRSAPAVLDQFGPARGGFHAVPPGMAPASRWAITCSRSAASRMRSGSRPRPNLAQTTAVGRSRLVDFERYRPVAARTSFYSIAEDERFIVEPVGRALVLAGFSGHGFKFGAVMGEAAALSGERSLSAVQARAAGNG